MFLEIENTIQTCHYVIKRRIFILKGLRSDLYHLFDYVTRLSEIFWICKKEKGFKDTLARNANLGHISTSLENFILLN